MELPEDPCGAASAASSAKKNFPMFLRVAARVVAQNPRILCEARRGADRGRAPKQNRPP
jgi:hypothetical protein